MKVSSEMLCKLCGERVVSNKEGWEHLWRDHRDRMLGFLFQNFTLEGYESQVFPPAPKELMSG